MESLDDLYSWLQKNDPTKSANWKRKFNSLKAKIKRADPTDKANWERKASRLEKLITGKPQAKRNERTGGGRGDGAAEMRARKAAQPTAQQKADVKRVAAATKAHKADQERKAKEAALMKEVNKESKPKEPRTIAEAKKMGKDYFMDKSGTKKAAVTKEELAASGMSLREYLNKKNSKTKAAKGGMAKKKPAYNKGGYANCGASVKPNGKSRS